jgi:CheY-like chemotaxis protein
MTRPLAGIGILVVDDDPDNAELLAQFLRGFGACIRFVTSGPKALEMLASFTPDVLLLDLAMPEMDGFELLQRIRSQPTLEHIPALAVTAYSVESQRERSVAAGFDAHVVKPIDIDPLAALILELLAERQEGPASRAAPRAGFEPQDNGDESLATHFRRR